MSNVQCVCSADRADFIIFCLNSQNDASALNINFIWGQLLEVGLNWKEGTKSNHYSLLIQFLMMHGRVYVHQVPMVRRTGNNFVH